MRASPIRLATRLWTLILAWLLTACVSIATPKPGVKACVTSGSPDANAPSDGALAILPSQVPGVEIDSATWHTRSEQQEFLANENLIYVAQLRATRDVMWDEMALLFEAPSARPTIGQLFDLGDYQRMGQYMEGSIPFLRPNVPRSVQRHVTIRSASTTGWTSALTYCPRSVRLVPQRDLALYVHPGLADALQRAELVATHAHDTMPLVVVADTVVDHGLVVGIVTGAALNTTDTTLRHMVVALVLKKFSTAYTEVSAADSARRDTLEYYVDSIPPRALIGFAGGSINYPERIIGRTAYPSSAIKGRPIAGVWYHHRTSWISHVPPPPATR